MTEAERIIDKVRKLQAHADSAFEIGSEAEAQAFAARVQELLTAYKLSAADVSRPAMKPEPINITLFGWADLGLKVRGNRVGWAEQLARLVAGTYYCTFIASKYPMGSIGLLIGRETDRPAGGPLYVRDPRPVPQPTRRP